MNKILVLEKEKAYKEEQEKKTKELKDIISNLEKRNNKKNEDTTLNKDDNNNSKDNKDKAVLNDVKESDNVSFKKNLSLDKAVSKSVSGDKVRNDIVSDEMVVDKSKKIFSCLLGLIALCIMIGVLLIIFL